MEREAVHGRPARSARWTRAQVRQRSVRARRAAWPTSMPGGQRRVTGEAVVADLPTDLLNVARPAAGLLAAAAGRRCRACRLELDRTALARWERRRSVVCTARCGRSLPAPSIQMNVIVKATAARASAVSILEGPPASCGEAAALSGGGRGAVRLGAAVAQRLGGRAGEPGDGRGGRGTVSAMSGDGGRSR